MNPIHWTSLGLITVDANPPGVWQRVLDYVGGLRLLRLRVVNEDAKGAAVATTWYQGTGDEAGPDGKFTSAAGGAAKTGLLLPSALRGALIAKIGGSTADLPDPAAPAAPYGTKRVFAVGSYCVVNLSAAEAGPLYLAMNDSPDSKHEHAGTLHVAIEEFLL
jgi:hypothetical protein